MIDWLLGLWKKNKILFIILIVPVAIAFGIKIYQEIIFGGAKKSLKNAKKKSDSLKDKASKQEAKANEQLDIAKEAEDNINKRNEDEKLDLDWHKKK